METKPPRILVRGLETTSSEESALFTQTLPNTLSMITFASSN